MAITVEFIELFYTSFSTIVQPNRKPSASAAVIFCSLTAVALSHYRWTLKNRSLIKTISRRAQ